MLIGLIANQLMAQNQFSNDLQLKVIYQHSYNRNGAALLPYLRHSQEKYRLAAAFGFASVQDSTLTDSLLYYVLKSKDQTVQNALLYSLGQLRLRSVGLKLQNISQNKALKGGQEACLIAIGKCAKLPDLKYFVNYTISLQDVAMERAYLYALLQGFRRAKSISQSPHYAAIQKRIEQISLSSHDSLSLQYIKLWNAVPAAPKSTTTTLKAWDFPVAQVPQILAKDYQGNAYHFIAAMNWDSLQTDQLYAMMQLPLPNVLKTHVADLYIKQTKQVQNLLPLFQASDVTIQAMLCEALEGRLKSNSADSNILALLGPHTLDSLKQFQSELYMPRDFEAYVAYEKLIKAIAHQPYQYQSWFQKGYSIPIDWHEINLIPANQQVELFTNKGRIVLQCQVNEAPASVANFLKLIDQGYYNQKYWHRMVPNFVVQGGCPRGDGWGNLDFVQRSEWSNTLRYSPGAVGLASAGKDSEGVQFFITHTYTPHLDGRYSIIAYVVEGQNIVDSLEVGDQIISMKRL